MKIYKTDVYKIIKLLKVFSPEPAKHTKAVLTPLDKLIANDLQVQALIPKLLEITVVISLVNLLLDIVIILTAVQPHQVTLQLGNIISRERVGMSCMLVLGVVQLTVTMPEARNQNRVRGQFGA